MQRIVGIGEMAISNNIEDTIKTFALGSCVGIVVYSPLKKIGGIIHIALAIPNNKEEALLRCCYYASTGVPYFINRFLVNYRCLKEELIIRIYGGADSIRKDDAFEIGKKNLKEIHRIFYEMNLRYDDMETGENVSRTIELNIATGEVTVSYQKIII